VIVEYLDTLSPVGKLIPSVGRERAEVKTWEALADGLLDASLLARLEATWAGRSDAERSQAWIDRQLGKVHAALRAMSQGLADKSYCVGIHLSLADIAVGCALGYLDFRFPQIDWRLPYPNLARLHEKLMQRPSFADTVPT
jgi:glutathione S-transferase